MKSQEEVSEKLYQGRNVAVGALEERDKRIDQLERQLAEARRPHNRVTLLGGPRSGDTMMAPSGQRVIEVLLPPSTSAYSEYAPRAVDLTVEVGLYRIERVRTFDGDSWIGVYQGRNRR